MLAGMVVMNKERDMSYQCIQGADCFEDWFAQLTTVAARREWYDLTEIDKPDWLGYYEDNYTPAEALDEDATHV